jgi:2-polyprenyl-3-methyl-5-hydroxy-6-metoxy-1,4-benzoquinol methylase
MERKEHWEKIYSEKELSEVSWYQPTPETSIQLIDENSSKDDAIIDIGGGDSYLVDHLLKMGYTNITVLDISANAIERAKERLGDQASFVTWIVSDVTEFQPTAQYDIWHDRAAFHFLRDEIDIMCYKNSVNKGLSANGKVIIGTFSESGPLKCSGIEIQQYDETSFKSTFEGLFNLKQVINSDHSTPFDTVQNFNFGLFER